jgi:hypothetical protein
MATGPLGALLTMHIILASVPENMAKAIEPYRSKYDPMAKVIPPHITILKPFLYMGSVAELHEHLHEVGEVYAPIKVSLAGWDTYEQAPYQLRLPLITGQVEFINLRQQLLTGPLKGIANSQPDYQPSVTFGRFSTLEELEQAKLELAGFEPHFIFRVLHLELLEWDNDPAHAWELQKRFGLEATLIGSRRRKTPELRERE